MPRKSLVEQYGSLPAGMASTDANVILQFLYGAFDRRTAKQVRIAHPYWEDMGQESEPPELTIDEFSRWLQAANV